MKKTIAFCNLKGGVGKTALTAHMAGPLLERGERVLLVDLDHQANLTSIFADGSTYNPDEGPGVSSALFKNTPLSNLIVQTTQTFYDENSGLENLAILPADFDLVLLDRQLGNDLNAPFRLAELLKAQADNFDYAFLDTPPNLGMATRMALIASDGYVVPLAADTFSLQGVRRLEDEVEAVRDRANPKLKCLGYVINNYQQHRTILERHVELFQEHFGQQLADKKIRQSVKYREALAGKWPITHYKKEAKSEWADDIRQLVKELDL